VIDEVPTERRRKTRAEQRVATRTAILDAAGRCLVEDGYPGLTTRRIAERAKVAQSTLMHHFPTRESLLVEAVSHLAMRLADTALDDLDLSAARRPEQREELLDQVWRVFTSPEALAAAQLWFAAWTEPELASALHDLEERLTAVMLAATTAVLGDIVDHPSFPALLETGLSTVRGLVMAIPVSGRDVVEERWRSIRPILARAGDDVLGDAGRAERPSRSRRRAA
jgi:AcrR family transcriptional regulator